eukprot:gene12959-15829_t
MKIGIVCYPTFGGSGVVATELGKALADEGHQVHFITYSQPARLDFFSANLFYHEVSVRNYPLFDYAPYESALASKLVDVVRFEKLDILHVHYAIPHASAAFMAKQILATYGIHIPVVTTLHGTDITLVGKDPTYKPVVTFSINQSDGITTVSQNLKEDTLKHFDITREIKVIPNFIDFQRFSLKPKDHFKKAIAPNNERILIHTSNFRKVKRTGDVILMFQQILKKIPSKLLMVGDGPEQEILSVSDLFLMPSESESFGLAALEAMACKVPAITSNSGGLPELNVDGFCGYMSNVGDVEEMAANAIKILENDQVLEQFKENALKRAQDFDLKKILPVYIEYYNEIMARQANPAIA